MGNGIIRRVKARPGDLSTYVNRGCRCEPCVEAQRESNRRRPADLSGASTWV